MNGRQQFTWKSLETPIGRQEGRASPDSLDLASMSSVTIGLRRPQYQRLLWWTCIDRGWKKIE